MIASVEHEGKTYELKMTRAGVRAAEGQGLDMGEIQGKPQSAIALMFFAALFSQYKFNPNKAATMLDDLLDSGDVAFEDLFESLSEQYSELFGLGESKE